MNREKIDSVMIEILRCQMQGIVEEMGEMVTRCGHTVFVKETQDFVVALVTPEGEVAACSQRVGIWIAIGQNFRAVIEAGGPYQEGDVWFTNDPEQSEGLVTHLPDTFCWRSIYRDGKLLCFAVAFIHCTDVGGLAPGSVAPSAVDQFQEGVVMPVTKLVEGGKIRNEILNIFIRNSRTPEKSKGDLLALLGALNRADDRVHQLADKFGTNIFQEGMYRVLDYAEEQARKIIREIPDGDHTFWDYLEGDFVPGGRPVRIHLTLCVHGEELTLDFTGTDPQVAAAFNIPSYGHDGHYILVMGIVNFMRTAKPDLVYNSGLVRPVKMSIPRGTLLNPEAHAPCGARQATFFRTADVVLGALCQAMPERMPAAGCGQGSIMLVSTPEVTTGERIVTIVQPLVGGSGARPNDDGTEGVDFATGFYRNIPSEVLESETPVLVEEYGLNPDSGGPGRTRGGTGLRYALRTIAPGSIVTSRALERYRFKPWGREGGHPGTNGKTFMNNSEEKLEEIGKIDVLDLPARGMIRMETAGGGGFGPPWEREPEMVLRDVEDGLVTKDRAEKDYGVILRGGKVDEGATQACRHVLRSQTKAPERFSFGLEREAFEQRWPDSVQRALNDATAGIPATLREYVRTTLIQQIGNQNQDNLKIKTETLSSSVEAILEELRPTRQVSESP